VFRECEIWIHKNTPGHFRKKYLKIFVLQSEIVPDFAIISRFWNNFLSNSLNWIRLEDHHCHLIYKVWRGEGQNFPEFRIFPNVNILTKKNCSNFFYSLVPQGKNRIFARQWVQSIGFLHRKTTHNSHFYNDSMQIAKAGKLWSTRYK
jgi:hypothetical protein